MSPSSCPAARHWQPATAKSNDLYLFDIATGKIIRKFVGHTRPSPNFAVAPNGKRILSWDDDGTMRLWDVDTGQEMRRLDGHTGKAAGVFSPDSKQILTFGPDRTLRLWDVETGQELKTLEGHTEACSGCFSPDGQQVLSWSDDHTIRLWDLARGQEVRRFEGSKGKVGFAGFVAGGPTPSWPAGGRGSKPGPAGSGPERGCDITSGASGQTSPGCRRT